MLAFFSNLVASFQGSWEPAFDETLGEHERGNVEISDLDEALTFARADVGGRRRVLAVTGYQGGMVEAVDLSTSVAGDIAIDAADPVAVFRERGYQRLAADIRSAPAAARLRI